MKKVYIIHGWSGYPEEGWFPWMKFRLEEKGYEVIVPEMPDADNPTIENWVGHLVHIVENPDKNTYFIGYSLGCQTILRYLETLQDCKIAKVVLVAGFFFKLNRLTKVEEVISKPWREIPIDLEKVKQSIGEINVILSDDDQYVPCEETKRDFEEKLGAKVIVKHKKGHFGSEDNIVEFPAILDFF